MIEEVVVQNRTLRRCVVCMSRCGFHVAHFPQFQCAFENGCVLAFKPHVRTRLVNIRMAGFPI